MADEPVPTEPTPTPEPPKGGPDPDQKAARLERELKERNDELAQLRTRVEELSKGDPEKDDLKTQLQKLTEEAGKAKATADRQHLEDAVALELTKAGCRNVKATRAVIEGELSLSEDGTVKGLDVEAVRKSIPELFASPTKVDTAGSPKGSGTSLDDRLEAEFKD